MKSKKAADNYELLLKTIMAENRLGWHNNAVFGGFGKFFTELCRRQCALVSGEGSYLIETIWKDSEKYQSLSKSCRQNLLGDIVPLIKQAQRILERESLDLTPPVVPENKTENLPKIDFQKNLLKSAPCPTTGNKTKITKTATATKAGTATKAAKRAIPKQDTKTASTDNQSGSTNNQSGSTNNQSGSTNNQSGSKNSQILKADVQTLKGVGPKSGKLLNSINIFSTRNLINHYPYKYEDRRELHQIHTLTEGMNAAIMGKITKCSAIRLKYKPVMLVTITVDDGTGSIGISFFNQNYLAKILEPGKVAVFFGKVTKKAGKMQIISPAFEIIKNGVKQSTIGGIVPFYRTCKGLPHKKLKTIIVREVEKWAPKIDERLPLELLSKHNLTTLSRALTGIHTPDTLEDIENARKRLVFEELFILQVVMAMKKRFYTKEFAGISIKDKKSTIKKLKKLLPFKFTKAQERVLKHIKKDLSSKFAMSRLLQGEVGSGKTIVALAALVATATDGFQGAFMAPTEILAEQHFITLTHLCAKLNITCELLTGTMTGKAKEAVLERISNGETSIVTGTHAIIQKDVRFKNLGLIIIDEQHRFGVNQRSRLRQKGRNPNLLVMTATPIPRTLCMTLYGDLDVSVLDEMPPGRQKVDTKWLKNKSIKKAWKHVENEIDKGRQCFIVCPRIDESEVVCESAISLYEDLSSTWFSHRKVCLLHGRMKSQEKEDIMEEMNEGKIDLLISTTIIEVGIDISNATIMVVTGAERFGLAQLHQLRGRVGRGKDKATCYLITDAVKDEQQTRMKTLESTNDGFKVAQTDLEVRGPGDFFGTQQSGIPPLQVADLLKDLPLLEIAKQEAFDLIDEDPKLQNRENEKLSEVIRDEFSHLVYFRS